MSEELLRRTGPHGLYGDPVLKDCVIVHNHPAESELASYPVSPADLYFAVTHNLSRFVLVSGARRYELRRPGNS